MRVVGPWEASWGWGWGYSQACRSSQMPAGGGSISALGGSFWAPGSAPWNVVLRCGGAARVASSPVLSGRVTSRLGRPEQPPCPGTPAAGGHQLSAGTEAASPAPRGTWALAPQPCQGLTLTA